MNGTSPAMALSSRLLDSEKRADRYYSAEFLVEDLGVLYQFKIWAMAAPSLSVLVNEKSGILRRLKVGDTLSVKYYSSEEGYPSWYHQTTVKHITKSDEGRLKGHFLVGLEIQDC